mgnify:CR=1 FL=1
MSLRYLSGNRLSTKRVNASNAVPTFPSAVNDLNFNQTSLLLSGDGVTGGQNNTFLDGSPNAFSITRNGNTTQGTFSPFSRADGYWSNYFDGSSSGYISLSNNTALQLGSTYTFEAWVYLIAYGTNPRIFSDGAINNNNLDICIGSSGQIYLSGAGAYTANNVFPLNQWVHLAVVINSGTATCFLNGISQTLSGSTTGFNSNSTNSRYIGGLPGQTAYIWNGYISNLRLVKGTAVYTSNFTPSTSPLTAISGTSLLTCQSNRFIDNSSNAFALTPSSSNKIQTFSPFPATSAYAAATNGGSGYFDSSGDYLSVASSTAWALTGDFTMELWHYPLSINNKAILDQFFSGSTGAGNMQLWLTTSTIYFYYDGNSNISGSSGTNAKLYSWNHIAVTRTGSTISLYLNGTRIAQGTFSGTVGQNNTFWVGSSRSSGYEIYGYVSDVRVLSGTNIYGTGTTLTVPTAPLTSVSGTQLLCNFTNANVIDGTMSNVLETIGTAQTSTTQSKFGGSSLYFSGSSSYLTCPSNPNMAFGTGDFTIEYWMYSNDVSSSTQKQMFQTSDTAGGLKTTYTSGIFMDQGYTGSSNLTGAIRANIIGTNVGSSVAVLTTGTWYHIALVRASGVVTIYVNGNSVASGTVSGSIDGTNLAVGCGYSTSYAFNGYIDDFRITKGVARYLYNFTPPNQALYTQGYTTYTPPTTDSYFGRTTALLHGDGTNAGQNNTFLDSSGNNFSITRNGNATQGSFSPFSRTDGYWSNYFNYPTTTDYLTTSSSYNLSGSTSWTIEAWFYPQSHLSGSARYFTLNGSYGLITGGSSNTLAWNNFGSGNVLTSTWTPSLNQWQHIALVNNAGTVTLYVNGQSCGTASNFMPNSSLPITIGGCGGTYAYGFQGYISNFRVLTGTALYTSNFTTPTTPLTAITNTSVLTCQSNRFKDNSTNAYTITSSGSTSVQTFSPFEPTAAYSASTNGGSGYFDGSGDYLTVPDNAALELGTNDFTIECWVYPLSFSGTINYLIGKMTNSSTASGFLLRLYDTTGVAIFYASSNGSTWDIVNGMGTVAPFLNAWNHVAVSRSGSSFRIWVNGVSGGTATSSGSIQDNSSVVGIGAVAGGGGATYGYISDARIVNGTALYNPSSSTITIPTAPLTSITNTKLLLSCQNSNIVDSAASVNLETVGNAQASTTQYKFGTGSMYFPGGSDYLQGQNNPAFKFSGAFTIELWIYPLTVSSRITMLNTATSASSASGIYFYISSTGYPTFDQGGGNIVTSSTPVVASTWTHIALTRNPNNICTIWVNGNATGSASSSQNFSDGNLLVGTEYSLIRFFYGYIDDLRITNGIARYNYNFTIPASAHPNY